MRSAWFLRRLYRFKKNASGPGLNGNIRFVPPFPFKYNFTIDKCKKSMIFAHTYIKSGMMLCASLSYNNISGFATLSAEYLYAQPLAF